MIHPVSVGIHVPSSAAAALDSGEAYAEYFRQVEALGLDAAWTEDRIFHEANNSRFDVDKFAIFGPAREVAARLVEHVDAGMTKLMLDVPDLDHAQLRRIAHEVAPAVRSAAAR